MSKKNRSIENSGKVKSRKWKLRKGNVLVVEDADTASLVIVARELKDLGEKITVLKEVLQNFEAQVSYP
jgi:hypothetical protein